ncbi:hypothetical protein BU202_01965 [Streptococcus cuniculi]|uniref:DUF1310 family protein n=1 Tax=Streptococcus cuniculi TaxID=1432788 RepID=A0A1Q8E9F1_9STRE|nr:DUF1310 family protein [Streptococcus cuniculi]OLF48408.1 hypothetical protein BU202_01965 [Streptococcus cuniculi]
MKKTWVMVSSIFVVLALIIGGFYMQKQSERQYMWEVVHSEEAKKIYEGYLLNVDPKAFTIDGKIQHYQILDEETVKNPMGGLIVELSINHQKLYNLEVFINKDIETGELKGTGTIASPELVAYLGVREKE